jgi:hypothetical protein
MSQSSHEVQKDINIFLSKLKPASQSVETMLDLMKQLVDLDTMDLRNHIVAGVESKRPEDWKDTLAQSPACPNGE